MAKLVMTLDGAFVGEHDLDKPVLTIGRRPTNDIHIDNLAVSGSHAAVKVIGNDFFLEDLDSTNGTIVNGKTIKNHMLQHGDVIELGKYRLRFVNEATVNTSVVSGNVEDFEKTMIIRPAAAKPTTPPTHAFVPPSTPVEQTQPSADVTASPPVEQAQPAAANEPLIARIQVLNGSSAGRELVINKALVTLGKPGVQVAVITRRPQGFFVTHVEGAKFPLVNGVSVGAQAHALNDHDVIELAGTKMEFFISRE